MGEVMDIEILTRCEANLWKSHYRKSKAREAQLLAEIQELRKEHSSVLKLQRKVTKRVSMTGKISASNSCFRSLLLSRRQLQAFTGVSGTCHTIGCNATRFVLPCLRPSVKSPVSPAPAIATPRPMHCSGRSAVHPRTFRSEPAGKHADEVASHPPADDTPSTATWRGLWNWGEILPLPREKRRKSQIFHPHPGQD